MRVVPSGGSGLWKYDQPFNGKFLHFAEQTKEILIEKVREFRVENDLDANGVTSDIEESFQKRKQPVPRPPASLRERVSSWKANRQFQRHEYVDQDVAEGRARICAGCPMNVVEWSDDCPECVAKTLKGLLALRQGKSTSVDSKVGACSVFGWDNKTSSHLDEKSLKNRIQHLDKAPDFCWAKKL